MSAAQSSAASASQSSAASAAQSSAVSAAASSTPSVSVTSAGVSQSSSGGSSGQNITYLPVGTVSMLTTFGFSDTGDSVSCLTADSTTTLFFAASSGGDIYNWSLGTSLSSIAPAFVAGTGSTGSYFTACQANAAGTQLYLLDTRGKTLVRYTVATPTVAPVTIATFSQEAVGAVTSLAIDFTANFAYVGTVSSDYLYSVDLTITGQFIDQLSLAANNLPSDVTSLALSADRRTLYFGSPAPVQGSPGTVKSVAVVGGTVTDSSVVTNVASSNSFLYPDSLLVVGSTVYVKDGGALKAHAGPSSSYLEAVYAFTVGTRVTSNLTTIFSTLSQNLPSGLVLSADGSRVYMVTAVPSSGVSNFESVLVVPVAVAPPSTSGAASSAGSASTGAARGSSSSAAVSTSSAPAASSTSTGAAGSVSSLASSAAAASSRSAASAASTVSSSAAPASSPAAAASSSSSAGAVLSAASAPSSSGAGGCFREVVQRCLGELVRCRSQLLRCLGQLRRRHPLQLCGHVQRRCPRSELVGPRFVFVGRRRDLGTGGRRVDRHFEALHCWRYSPRYRRRCVVVHCHCGWRQLVQQLAERREDCGYCHRLGGGRAAHLPGAGVLHHGRQAPLGWRQTLALPVQLRCLVTSWQQHRDGPLLRLVGCWVMPGSLLLLSCLTAL